MSADPATRREIPDATVARLPVYLRALTASPSGGTDTVSSEELAPAAGVGSAKLRKDLCHLGSYGIRGVGYDVDYLVVQISRALGLTQDWPVAIVGMGNLGHALAATAASPPAGFRVAALLDADPPSSASGRRASVVRPLDELERRLVRSRRIAIGVIATPAPSAQAVCDRLVAAGVSSVLNFAPGRARRARPGDGPPGRPLTELQILAFHEQRRSRRRSTRAGGGGPMSLLVVGLSHRTAPSRCSRRRRRARPAAARAPGRGSPQRHVAEARRALHLQPARGLRRASAVPRRRRRDRRGARRPARGVPLAELTAAPLRALRGRRRRPRSSPSPAAWTRWRSARRRSSARCARPCGRARTRGHGRPVARRPAAAGAAGRQAGPRRDRHRPRRPLARRGRARRRPSGRSARWPPTVARRRRRRHERARRRDRCTAPASATSPSPTAPRPRPSGWPGHRSARGRADWPSWPTRSPRPTSWSPAPARSVTSSTPRLVGRRRAAARRHAAGRTSTWPCRATSTRRSAGLPGVDARRPRALGRDPRRRPASTTLPEVQAGARLVAEEVADYLAARAGEAVAPTVVALRARAAAVVEAELDRLDQRLPGPRRRRRAPRSQHAVHRVVEKLLHTPDGAGQGARRRRPAATTTRRRCGSCSTSTPHDVAAVVAAGRRPCDQELRRCAMTDPAARHPAQRPRPAQSRWVADAARGARRSRASSSSRSSTARRRRRRRRWRRIGGTGVFVSALREALLAGDVDLAVHSLKDLPTAPDAGLVLAAMPAARGPPRRPRGPRRADPRRAPGRVARSAPARRAGPPSCGARPRPRGRRRSAATSTPGSARRRRAGSTPSCSPAPGWPGSAASTRPPRCSTRCRCCPPRARARSPSSAGRDRADVARRGLRALDDPDTRACVDRRARAARRARGRLHRAGRGAGRGRRGRGRPRAVAARRRRRRRTGRSTLRRSLSGPVDDPDGLGAPAGRRSCSRTAPPTSPTDAAEPLDPTGRADGRPAVARLDHSPPAPARSRSRDPHPPPRRAGKPVGRVAFVGAGPGDPGLLTLRARRPARAPPTSSSPTSSARDGARRRHARPDVEVIDAGFGEDGQPLTRAVRAKLVVRAAKSLGGAASSSGSWTATPRPSTASPRRRWPCRKAGVPFEVVPGVSAATAVPAYAGVPADVAPAARRPRRPPARPPASTGRRPTPTDATLVRPRRARGRLAPPLAGLLAAGPDPQTPGGAHRARHDGRTAHRRRRPSATSTALLGQPGSSSRRSPWSARPSALRDELSWFETKPLFGWTGARAAHQGAGRLDGRPARRATARSPTSSRRSRSSRRARRSRWRRPSRAWSPAATSGSASPRSTPSAPCARSSRSSASTPAPSPASRSPPSAASPPRRCASGASSPTSCRAGEQSAARPARRLAAVRRGARPDQPGVPAARRHRHRHARRRPARHGLGGRRRHGLPAPCAPPRRPPRSATRSRAATSTRSSSRRARRCATSSASPASRTRRRSSPCIGPATAKTAQEHGLRVDVLAPEASSDAPRRRARRRTASGLRRRARRRRASRCGVPAHEAPRPRRRAR